jgi:putative aminopeptidase FrvX
MELLKKLAETPGVPGHEDAIRALTKSEMTKVCDRVKTDALGNVIGWRGGRPPKGKKATGRKVMVVAHMDEIGFMVSYVEEKTGFLRIHPIGGFDPKTLIAQRVMVHGKKKLCGVIGSKPIHIMTPLDREKLPRLEDLHVDLGLPAKTVTGNVSIGDMVSLEQSFLDLGECVTAKALDDRVGVYVMLEALRKVRSHQVDVFAVGSVQEEVGLRGATASAFGVAPDIVIALDVTIACDVPGVSDDKKISILGGGVAIKIMDSSFIASPKLVRKFQQIAKKKRIKHQMEILPRGGTDAGGVQRAGGGVAAMTLSIPTRYVHSVVEMAHKKDIQAAIALLAAFLEVAHEGSYEL